MLRRIAIGVALLLIVAAVVVIRFDLPAAEVEQAYRTAHSKFATLPDGTRMHYWDRGNRAGRPLVLLHGSYDCANTFERLAPLLDRDFRLIVPDLPAHGLTGRTKVNDYSIEGMVGALHGLVEHLQLARFDLAGNSMGGNTSWRYTVDHPERVERLVLIDSAGYPGIEGVTRRATNPVTGFFLTYGNPKRTLRTGFERAVADDSLITDNRVERLNAFVRREGGRTAHLKRAEQRDYDGQPHGSIREIQQPTLILWGDRDALIPVAHSKRFEQDLPHVKRVIYPGIGHMPQLEVPERVAQDMREFLLGAAPPPPG